LLLGLVLLEAVIYCSTALISTLYSPLANGGGFLDSQRGPSLSFFCLELHQ